jgi:hypothetical protein
MPSAPQTAEAKVPDLRAFDVALEGRCGPTVLAPLEGRVTGLTGVARCRLPRSPGYIDNSLTTSKYTILNFVPKNVWEQFHRVANVYFLFIAALQVSGYISPTLDLSPTHKLAT